MIIILMLLYSVLILQQQIYKIVQKENNVWSQICYVCTITVVVQVGKLFVCCTFIKSEEIIRQGFLTLGNTLPHSLLLFLYRHNIMSSKFFIFKNVNTLNIYKLHDAAPLVLNLVNILCICLHILLWYSYERIGLLSPWFCKIKISFKSFNTACHLGTFKLFFLGV